ncbi:MAG: TerC family protein [Bacteroidetes bacterium]|nr:TerC family protein [Bacteroidota bacterium]
MTHLLTPEGIVALLTLTILEIVLGIDNIIFISILVGKLPPDQAQRARTIGLSLAVILRIVFLFGAVYLATLTEPFLVVFSHGITGRDVIMFGGGLFLIAKATTELHSKLEGKEEEEQTSKSSRSFALMVLQIIILDLVFSIDSVITAIGLSQDLLIMVIAVVVAVIVMQISAKSISHFIEGHPTIKVLALAFLIMVGFVLVVEGFHVHVPKGYIYAAMAFSISVEMLNIRMRRKLSDK